EAYAKQQGLWHEPAHEPVFSEVVELDLSTVRPSLAGPARPQDRVPLDRSKALFRASLSSVVPEPAKAADAARRAAVAQAVRDGGSGPDDDTLPNGVRNGTTDEALMESFPASDPPAYGSGGSEEPGSAGPGRRTEISPDPAAEGDRYRQVVPVALADGTGFELDHGHVVIAAITSCTNTSNPSVMVAAGLLAKKAVERGLTSKAWVKTSLAPGSKVVADYLKEAGLTSALEELGFHIVGYGCTTCIGNSGPLPEPVAKAIESKNLVAAAVLSGNRNFEGRVNALCRANYLASPPLVVAYALAGRMDLDLSKEPLGTGKDGKPVFLKDLWPSNDEVAAVVAKCVQRAQFEREYAEATKGDEAWRQIAVKASERYGWDEASTYVQDPPYFEGFEGKPRPLVDVKEARCLLLLGDSVTTDHISPAGSFKPASPAGKYLVERGVPAADFNSYGSRRGNHEVMMRGTFANIRIRNQMLDNVEGGYTLLLPEGTQTTVFDAAMAYNERGTPLVVVAGKEYGTGSSRDWAAKGPALLGVQAVIAESYERIHRSNLVGMGVLPLQFKDGESAKSLGLTGRETFSVTGIAAGVKPRMEVSVTAEAGGKRKEFKAVVRIDTPAEVEYYRYGGILHYVLSQLGSKEPVAA
ncbi:MAG: aconitate hydratase AcnA, partial [Elusimicrobia bacterium]|nr:aconitate hydratase AcnA [Elusimicrobiota bacterium]